MEPGLTVLPGQYLRFATADPIFGQVREVRALPPSSPGLMGGYRLLIDLLYGTPSLNPQQVVLLNASQMGHEIQRLQEPIAQPLRLSPDFSAELHRLGALTVIGGDDFVQKYEALQLMLRAIQPHCRLVIFDPLGIFAEEDGYAFWEAGRHVRLSLQTVGSKSFLDTFGELFAPGLREAALRIVADHLPPMHEFLGFQSLLDWYGSLNVPLKNLILQNFEQVAYAAVFADAPEQALDWRRASQNAVTVLNLSGLPEAWRGLFFREAMQALLAQSGGEVIPVLIHPENYLSNLPQWVRRADESEFRLLMLASSYADTALLNMANNRLWAESSDAVSLMGSLTLGLPLTLPALNTLAASGPRSAEASFAYGASSVAPSASPNREFVPVEERMYGGFSSFNVPIVDLPGGEPGASGSDFQSSEMEPPLHWLGEAADPLQLERSTLPAEGQDSTLNAPENAFAESEMASLMDEPIDASDLGFVAGAVSAALPPVVDLASPQPEVVPEFLTASQLSDLLASGSQRMHAQAASGLAPSQTEEPFSIPPVEAPVSAELSEAVFKPPAAHHPEPVFPSVMEDGPPVQPPAEHAALLSADHFPPVEPAQESPPTVENFSGFEPHVEPPPEAEPELHTPLPSPPSEPAPALPPFPAPEEYERDEFHFDLNPDANAYEAPAFNGQGAAYGETDFVSQSLDEFSADDPGQTAYSAPQAEEEHFHFDAGFSDSEPAVPPSAESREGSGILSGIAATDQELSDTLDLIFPNYPHTGPHAEDSESQSEPEAPVAPKPVRDEPMEIIQKDIEPPRGQAGAFLAGDRVTHPAYGQGVVQKVIPTEESVVLNIMFDTVGKRLLDPALCELARAAVR